MDKNHQPVEGAIAERKTITGLNELDLNFREMLDALPVAIYTTDVEGRLTHFNPAAVEFSGHVPKLGTDQWCVSWKLYYPDGTPMPHNECPMAITLKEGRPVRGMEAIAERPDGKRIWFKPYPTPLHDSAGRVIGGINMLVDITESKRIGQARAHLAAIVESSDDAIVSKNLQGIITSWNKGAEKLFGYTSEETIGQSITMLIPTERLDEEPRILDSIQRGEKVDHYETIRQHKDGSEVHISLTVSPIRNEAGKIVGASKIARDISERKHAEAALRESEQMLKKLNETLEQKVKEQTREVRSLASELTKVEQRERHRLAQILHDELQQNLYAIKMHMAFLPSGSKQEEGVQEVVHSINTQLDQAVTLIRNLSIDLSAPILHDEGLTQAIQWLAAFMREKYGLHIEVRAEESFAIPDAALQVLLYNSVRELLFNIVKHAGVNQAVVALSRVGENLLIEVSDEGKGFQPAESNKPMGEKSKGNGHLPSSFGLPMIGRRIRLFEGHLHIQSQPGEGTQVLITIPVYKGK